MALMAVICVAGNSFAQENAGGSNASKSAFGDIDEPKIVAGAVGVALLGAMVANNRGSTTPTPVGPTCGPDEKLENGVCVPVDPVDPECEADEELIEGECVPIPPTTTTTTTTTVTTPVTVTATTTAL